MPTEPPAPSRLILLGAARFPGLPSVDPAQAAPLAHSAGAIEQYFASRMGVKTCLNLFDHQASASEQIKLMKEYLLLSPRGSRVFIYYIGHGLLVSGAGAASEYVLACRDTSAEAKLGTSLTLAAIGEMLKTVAAQLDIVMVLDCCFAAMALSPLQVGCRSLALLAASSRYKAAVASPTAMRTQFSDCVCRALESGSAALGERLSLSDLELLVREKMRAHYPDSIVDPELHAPKYGVSDPRQDPLFPNPAYRRSTAAAAPSTAYLTVQIEPEKRRSPRLRYHVKAWMLIETAQEQYWGELIWDTESGNEGKPVQQGQLPQLLQGLHQGAADWLLARNIDHPDFWIELVVPRELLDERFDQMQGVNGPLGADHHIVVRSWERLRIAQSAAQSGPAKLKISLKSEAAAGPAGSAEGCGLTADAVLRQRQRWEHLHSQQLASAVTFVELPGSAVHGAAQDRALGAWIRADCPAGRPLWDPLVTPQGQAVACALMEQAPAAGRSQMDTFVTLLRAGIPVMLWVRGPSSPTLQTLRGLLGGEHLRQLPERVRALRKAAAADPAGGHIGRDLTLLWDNPHRLPARIRFHEPEVPRSK